MIFRSICRHLICNYVTLSIVPEDIHGSVQCVTLRHVPVDVLPKLLIWFSHVKHLECQVICPPREVKCTVFLIRMH